MVVFTCQHCGDPVKKPAVEKHYNTKCHNRSPHLTCVDCLKDFSSEDYGRHNQCMTEAQRYSAQGTVFKEQKGKKKQEKYIEMIQRIINSKDLNLSIVQKKLLEVCSNSDNVPKKPKPFENFMKNVARHINCNIKDIQCVFNIIEEAWKKETEPTNLQAKGDKFEEIVTTTLQEVRKSNGKTHKINEDINGSKINKKTKFSNHSFNLNDATENSSNEYTNNHEFTNEHTSMEIKKEKNKILTDESLQMDVINQENDSSLSENSKEVSESKHNNEFKKLKKYRRKNKAFSLDSEVTESPEVNTSKSVPECDALDDIKENDIKVSRKQIKKQKKYEKYLEELENEKNIVVNENEVSLDAKESNASKKKSKKNKTSVASECISELQIYTEDKNSIDKKYPGTKAHSKENKKRKFDDCDNVVPEKKTKEHSDDGIDTSNPAVFNWGDIIIKVLNSRPDKELSLKKLGKKVVNEYQEVKQDHRTYEDLLAKFNKKVNKVKGVRVLRDKAKLLE